MSPTFSRLLWPVLGALALSACFDPVAAGTSDDVGVSEPADAANPPGDDASTISGADADTALTDAATPPADTGNAGVDAGNPVIDSGVIGPIDAGQGPVDAGSGSADGSFEPDGSVVSPDAGIPPPGCIDNDGDFYGVGARCLGPDCNDADKDIHPGAAELCDGKDNDCSGTIDDVPPRACRSACGQGIETCVSGKTSCSAPQPKPETCDGTDEDCNGIIDDGVKKACSSACGSGVQVCTNGNFGLCSAKQPTAEICGDGVDNDCNGTPDDAAVCAAPLAVYVDGVNGRDTNSGTKLAPLQTIAKGISTASAAALTRVYVARGLYKEDVTLTENVSLFGGYDPTFATRDPVGNLTSIEAQAVDPISGISLGLTANATITAKTLVDGFSIKGRTNTSSSSAMTLSGSPVISNCVVQAGDAGVNVAINVYTSLGFPAASPTLRGVRATGGASTADTGRAIAINCSGAQLTIDSSTFLGGRARSGPNQNAATSLGLAATSCRVNATNSTFTGGGDADEAVGIYGATAQLVLTTVQADGGGAAGRGSDGLGIEKASSLVATNSTFKGGLGCGGQGGYGLAASDSTVQVDAATILGALNATNIQCETAGLLLVRGAARVMNSVIFGGEGNVANGVTITNPQNPTGESELNGNYINGQGNPRLMNSISRGISFEADATNTPARGVVRNNIINGGSGRTAASGIREGRLQNNVCGGQPRLLENNDLYRSSGNGALYIDCGPSGATTYNTVAGVNGLTAGPAATKNLSADPRLTSETVGAVSAFHLSDKTSPCWNAGTSLSAAPATDLDGEARPKDGLVDIGPDEL